MGSQLEGASSDYVWDNLKNNDNSELFLIGDTYWELISLDNFKNYIHWSD